MEFSEYRKYELGDNPRHIDWGVYARSDRLYVKRFREEQDLPIMIFLDSSPSMAVPEEAGKWERARNIALSLAYVALMEQDSVRIALPGQSLSPTYYGARAFHEMARSLATRPDFRSSQNLPSEVLKLVAQLKFPGLAIFISDFLFPIEEVRTIFNALRAKNLDICAIQILSEEDQNPLASLDQAIAVDSESAQEVELVLDDNFRSAYRDALDRHNLELSDYLTSRGVRFALDASTLNLSEFLVRNLTATGLLR
jgi:uncharacterized protein (DUF58 family)